MLTASPRRCLPPSCSSNYWIFKGASRTDLVNTVMKTLPKDTDISWVQSDDDNDDGSDDDVLKVESEEGEQAGDDNEAESVYDGADRDPDLSGDEDERRAAIRRSRRSWHEVDVMEDVPEPEEPEEGAASPKSRTASPEAAEGPSPPPADGQPEWEFEEFEQEAPIELDQSDDDDEPVPEAKAPRPQPIRAPSVALVEEEDDDDDMLVIEEASEGLASSASCSDQSSGWRPCVRCRRRKVRSPRARLPPATCCRWLTDVTSFRRPLDQVRL